MDTVNIHGIGREDEQRAVSVQVMAFASDPTARWFYPEAHDYLAHFPGFVRAFGGRAFENSTAYASEGFGGVALWLPVGVQVDGDPLERHFRETLGGTPRDEMRSMFEQMETYHTTEPHWYLAVIGVDPAQQGKGIGSALLRHGLAPCDEQGLLAYLESSNPANIPLYERHGFEVMGEIQVGSSPPMFPMLRSPR